jgi:hypothetical protein
MADEALDLDLGPEGDDSGKSGSDGSRKRGISQIDFGKPDTMRHAILSWVSNASYERAVSELELYIETKRDYPTFRPRVTRLQAYCNDLINAIKAKKNLPGLNLMSVTKQQELHDRVLHHMIELGDVLRRIEGIEKDVRLEDLRSTVWVLKTLVAVVLALAVMLLAIDISKGFFNVSWLYMEDLSTDMTDWIFSRLGL